MGIDVTRLAMTAHQAHRDDLRAVVREICDATEKAIEREAKELARRLDEVNAHLSILNGRVAKGERLHSAHHVRLNTLERTGDETRRRRHDAPDTDMPPMRRKVSERDVKLVLSTLGVVGTLLLAIEKIIPWLKVAAAP
ncbi:MAG TPA: hypothetical protein VNJ04_12095 [Gemmatimonadaceae bacterium]|nr:hypothetical protein [Gemmatimonadaceae bacterium]